MLYGIVYVNDMCVFVKGYVSMDCGGFWVRVQEKFGWRFFLDDFVVGFKAGVWTETEEFFFCGDN